MKKMIKYLTMLCLIIIFTTVSGCGEKKQASDTDVNSITTENADAEAAKLLKEIDGI